MKDKKKIKVSFPHMGTIAVAWSAALRKFGVEAYVPPYTNKKALSLGVKNSPESVCLPYKLIMGNFIEAIDGGADYVAMLTSPGCCRLGVYGLNLQSALSDLGYEAKYVELSLYDGIKGLYKFFRDLTGKNNWFTATKAIYMFIRMVFALDDLETLHSYYRAREVKTGEADRHYNKCLDMYKKINSTRELKKIKKEVKKEMSKVEIDKNREVLHVDLTGEIYMVDDPFANQYIEKELGKMGVQTRRSLTVGSFMKDAIIPKIFRKGETHLQRADRLAKPYLTRDIGGDSLESVSDVVYADLKGTDGIIHISPFTCMPEIMSQNIFPSVREDHNIPILTLVMDEQSGKAGYITRLEAFVDLMRRKKRLKNGNKNKEEIAAGI
jgi:predicted nucleotide-binding protein (sugar kinase/HSP70/actin superfamily)